jgi:glycerophosphoryl diester phosphodiesterase
MLPLLIAHRGDTVNFPENTPEAFKSALEKGADGIELDVQLNSQGEVIVVHNHLFDINKKYPTLANILEQFSTKGFLEIELKGWEIKLVEKVAALIKQYQPTQFTLTSSVLPLLPYVHQLLPSADIGAIIKPYYIENWMTPALRKQLLLGYMKLIQANTLQFYQEYCTKELVTACHEQGYLAHYHLFTDSLDEYQQAKNLNVDRCTFDKISLLEKINKP